MPYGLFYSESTRSIYLKFGICGKIYNLDTFITSKKIEYAVYFYGRGG